MARAKEEWSDISVKGEKTEGIFHHGDTEERVTETSKTPKNEYERPAAEMNSRFVFLTFRAFCCACGHMTVSQYEGTVTVLL